MTARVAEIKAAPGHACVLAAGHTGQHVRYRYDQEVGR